MTDSEILAAAGITRKQLGRRVRQERRRWARTQPDVAEHPSWLVPWSQLADRDRDADVRIGVALFCAGFRAREAP